MAVGGFDAGKKVAVKELTEVANGAVSVLAMEQDDGHDQRQLGARSSFLLGGLAPDLATGIKQAQRQPRFDRTVVLKQKVNESIVTRIHANGKDQVVVGLIKVCTDVRGIFAV